MFNLNNQKIINIKLKYIGQIQPNRRYNIRLHEIQIELLKIHQQFVWDKSFALSDEGRQEAIAIKNLAEDILIEDKANRKVKD